MLHQPNSWVLKDLTVDRYVSWTGPGAPWQLPPSGALAAALVAIEQSTPRAVADQRRRPAAHVLATEPIPPEIKPVARTSRTCLTAPVLLVQVESAILRREWFDPDRARVPLRNYAETWMEQRPGL